MKFYKNLYPLIFVLVFICVLSFDFSASASENTDYSQYSDSRLETLAKNGDMHAVFTQAYNLIFAQEEVRENADFETALKLLHKAHDNGHETANSLLTLYYSGGFGHEPNIEKANKIEREAADNGSSIAQLNFGLSHINSEDNKIAERALFYLEQAANNDTVEEHAIPTLIEIYYGIYDDKFKNYSKGREWSLKCLETLPENAFCPYILGRDFENGWSGIANSEKSVSFYRLSAQKGDMRAQWILGMRYLNGNGVSPSESKAFHWVQKSADQNYLDGQLSLGVMYALGQGTKIDKIKSFESYEKAAKQGSGHALRSIGAMYCSGEAPITNRKLCAAGLILAHEMNDNQAILLLNRFFQTETPKEIELLKTNTITERSLLIGRYALGEHISAGTEG